MAPPPGVWNGTQLPGVAAAITTLRITVEGPVLGCFAWAATHDVSLLASPFDR